MTIHRTRRFFVKPKYSARFAPRRQGDSAAEYMDQRVLTGQIQLFQNHGFLIGDGFRRRVKIDLFSQHHLENRVFGRRQTGEDQGADHMLLRRHAGGCFPYGGNNAFKLGFEEITVGQSADRGIGSRYQDLHRKTAAGASRRSEDGCSGKPRYRRQESRRGRDP